MKIRNKGSHNVTLFLNASEEVTFVGGALHDLGDDVKILAKLKPMLASGLFVVEESYEDTQAKVDALIAQKEEVKEEVEQAPKKKVVKKTAKRKAVRKTAKKATKKSS